MDYKYILITALFYLPICTPSELPPKYFAFKEAVEAIDAIALRLEALLTSNSSAAPRNFLVSPLSAAIVVGQLILGTEGEFQDELYNLISLKQVPNKNTSIIRTDPENSTNIEVIPYGLLHLQLGSLMRQFRRITQNSSIQLEVANALFFSSKIKLKSAFKRYLTQYYNSELIPLDFAVSPSACQKTINEWGSSHTKGLIEKILSDPPPPSTSSIFANAIYFQGNWKYPFSSKLNYEGSFNTAPNKTVKVTFMQNFLEDIYYAESSKYKCKIISLPYEENDLGLYIILPNEDNENAYNINAFSQSLKASDILELISSASIHDVIVTIPKMELTSSINLLEPLQQYRSYIKDKRNRKIREVRTNSSRPSFKSKNFKDSLDELEEKVDDFIKSNKNITHTSPDIFLSNAAEGQNFMVSDLFQEMTFNINEKGTEAAVISAGIIDYIGGSKVVNIKRPFVFFVRHEDTTATIFWGTIADPTQTKN